MNPYLGENDRDPRVDPTIGDVLAIGRRRYTVRLVERRQRWAPGWVPYQLRLGSQSFMRLESWRRLFHPVTGDPDAVVVKAARRDEVSSTPGRRTDG